MRYISPELAGYSSFIIDPVIFKAHSSGKVSLNPSEAAEVARYFNESLAGVLSSRGYQLTNQPGVGVGRVRIALTDVAESIWWLNLHPASRLSGVGTGGAAMEGEIIDSVSGEQLGAVIQAGKGSQFELDSFSKLDDVKDTINRWSDAAGKRLDELRAQRAAAGAR